MSKSRSMAKPKKNGKLRNFPLLSPLSCRLGYIRIFIHDGLHIIVAAYNCDISSKSRVHPLGYATCIPPHKTPAFIPILHHSLACLSSKPLFLKNSPSQYQSTSSAAYPNTDPLNNPVILHSLHTAQPPGLYPSF